MNQKTSRRATHIGYKHPRHLRVVDGGKVLCVAPSVSDYSALSKRSLPQWKGHA